MMKIEANVYAEIDYVLLTQDGEVLDDSAADGGKPIRYIHGYGMLVPGLEARLLGLRAADSKDIVVPATEAYGDHDDDLVYELDKDEVGGEVEEGDEVILQDEEGEEASVYVVEVRGDAVVVDGNHPLAGVDLRYKVSVREVREATEDELRRAALTLDEVRPHVHGPDCLSAHAPEIPVLGLTHRKSAKPS